MFSKWIDESEFDGKMNWARASVILLTAFVVVIALVGGFLLFSWYLVWVYSIIINFKN